MGILFCRRAGWKIRIMAMANVFACIFFLTSTILASYICWFWIQPYFYANQIWLLIANRTVVVVLFTNVIGQFALCLLTDCSTRRLVPGSSHWKMCNQCKLPRPPRSHHCKLCGTCILKRDHHCFFMTVCIGYHNQKHFIMFCLHMSIGAFYAVIFTVKYLVDEFDIKFYGPQTFFTLLFSLLRHLVNGLIPTGRFLILLYLLYVSLAMGLICCGFLFWQLMISACGQTTHEAWNGIEPKASKKNSAIQNLNEVFGKFGLLLVLLPLPLPQSNTNNIIQYNNSGKNIKTS